jgi:Pyruvate/2-oxoacid:ferredoxin oxidoreductase delta subunit
MSDNNLVPEERDLANALRLIVKKHGKFNEDNTGVWAGYTPAAENEVKDIGVACKNCVFYTHDTKGKDICQIISLEIEELGKCRFAVIPDGVVTPKEVFSKAPNLVQEELKKKINTMGDRYTEESVKISDLVPTQDYLDLSKLHDAGDNTKLITVYLDDEGYKLVDGHHRCAYKVGAGKGDIMAKVYRGPLVATAGSKPAPKKDQIKGSDKNKKGSADTGKGVEFTAAITKALEKKVADHNKKAPNGRKVTLAKLKAVYRRGAGAFSTSHRPDQNRNSWAMARVNAFLKLVKSGKPNNPKYTTDNDLLPRMHPRSSEASNFSPLIASLVAAANTEACPPATQDIVLNIENRQNAIDNVGYGPLNPDEPNEEFWQEKADRWKTTPVEASKSICGNCVFFVKTPSMLDCISSGIEEGGSGEQNAWDAIDQADLGFCEALDFKCAASRTCNAWAAGGPITEEK